MKTFLVAILLCVAGVKAATPLGVLYESTTTNNLVSPVTLTVPNLNVSTNFTLSGQVANQAVQLNAAKQLVSALLSSSQQDTLASWVGGTTTLNLGSAQIISGQGSPTNGTAYLTRILYINSLGTNLNDTFWGNYGTNWYAIASTNGGSITENQFNFSDNTTANVTTNMHGLIPKLPGDPLKFFNGNGFWVSPPLVFADTVSNNEIPIYNTNGPTLNTSGIFRFGASDLELRSGAFYMPALHVTNTAWINELFMTNSSVPAESLLRLNTAGQLKAVTIGAGLTFNGVTLSQSGSGTNAIGITGSPEANQVTYWSGPNTITGSTNITFSGTNTIISGLIITNIGNVYGGSYVPTRYVISGCTTIGASTNAMTYQRVGNIISVNGLVQVIRNSSDPIIFDITVPVPATRGPAIISSDNYTGNGFQENGTFIGGATCSYDLIQSQLRSQALVRVTSVGNSTAGSTVRNFWINYSYDLDR